MIPFNKPYLTGRETDYIREAVASGKIWDSQSLIVGGIEVLSVWKWVLKEGV